MGRYLGDHISDEQRDAILRYTKHGEPCEEINVGDYWIIGGEKWTVTGFVEQGDCQVARPVYHHRLEVSIKSIGEHIPLYVEDTT